MPFSTVQTHTIHSFRAVHNSLTCFDKKCTLSHMPEAMVTQKSQVNKDHLHFLWVFSSSFFPSGRQGLRKEKEKCQGLRCQELKKKVLQTHDWMHPPHTSYYLASRKVAFFSWPPFTSKEFFIPSRSWSLTYLSPLMMYKKVKEISQCSFKNCPLQGSQ